MGLVTLIATVIPFSFIVTIWISTVIYVVYHFYAAPKGAEGIHRYLKSCTLLYLISYSIAYFTALLLAGFALSGNQYFWNGEGPGWNILISIIGVFGGIGFISHYLFIAARLYYAFEPTIFKLKKRTMYIFNIVVVV